MSRPRLNPRPLVVRFGAMGDMVMLTSVLRELSERFSAPCDVVASQGSPQLVFRELDEVGDVYTIQSRRRPFWLSSDQRELVRQLRRRGPSPTLLLDDLPKVSWLMRRAGIPSSLLIGSVSGRLATASEFQRVEPRGDLEHFMDFAHRIGRGLGVGPLGLAAAESTSSSSGVAPFPPQLRISEGEREDCRRWVERRGLAGHPLVLLQTLSRRVRRGRWPHECWRHLARAVLERMPNARLLLTGSPEETPLIDALERSIGLPEVESVSSELPLRRLFALLERAHSCVSIDTGPAHAAAALGCPLVVLFGCADPRRNLPRGRAPIAACCAWEASQWPATRMEWETQHKMQQIEPSDVIAAWHDVMRRSDRAPGRRDVPVG